MDKYNLEDCSIVIPVKIDCSERLENINFLLQYFPRFFFNFQLIVIELGKEPIIKYPNHPGIYHEFLRSAKEFALSEICNIGASLVKTPYFCKCDTDVYIDPKAIFDGFEKLKSDPSLSFIIPYNEVSLNIKSPLKEEMMTSCDFNRFPLVKLVEERPENPNLPIKCWESTGLIHLFRTSVFKEFGGYNEEFIEWGYEDDEMRIRFEKLGHPVCFLENYNVYHLDHFRGTGSAKLIDENKNRRSFVENMTTEQIRNYIKTWSRFV